MPQTQILWGSSISENEQYAVDQLTDAKVEGAWDKDPIALAYAERLAYLNKYFSERLVLPPNVFREVKQAADQEVSI